VRRAATVNRSRRGRVVAVRNSSPAAAVSRALSVLLGDEGGDIGAIEAFARVRPLPAGQAVFARHERAHDAVLVAHGSVALGLDRGDGEFEVERIARAPAWIQLASAWLGATHGIDARAHSACVVVELPLEPLRERLERQPSLSLCLIDALAREVQGMASQTAGLMHSQAPARLAQWLSMHAKPSASAPGQLTVELGERKRDLAAQLAIAPETLSRLLRRLVRERVIDVAGYTVHVVDRAALDRLARL
jgi:CRP-like cAMP-binding protein